MGDKRSLRSSRMIQAQRTARPSAIAGDDLVLASDPMPGRGHAVRTAQPWHIVILDDALALRAPSAETTRQETRLISTPRRESRGSPTE